MPECASSQRSLVVMMWQQYWFLCWLCKIMESKRRMALLLEQWHRGTSLPHSWRWPLEWWASCGCVFLETCERAIVVVLNLECAITQRQQPPIFAVTEIVFFSMGEHIWPPLLHPWQKGGNGATMCVKKDRSGPDGHGVDDKHYTSFVMIGFLYWVPL